MVISDVRDAVLAWAHQHGVLAETLTSEPGINTGDPDILPFEAEHADYFRTRKIFRVTSEERRSQHVLKIFSRLKVAKTKTQKLATLFDTAFRDHQIGVEFAISRPFKIDNAVQSYGRFQPLHCHGERFACGSSIGLGNQRNAGTLTALARRRGDNKYLYGLSCNHVVGGCSTARPGTPISLPGIQDVSADHNKIHVIGLHFAAAPMSQGLPSVFDISSNRDLACFRLTAPDILTSKQGSGEFAYDTPVTFADVTVGLAVKKWGRSTRLTYGRIDNKLEDGEPIDYKVTSFYGPMNSQAFTGTVYFGKVYEIAPSIGPGSDGGPFSLGGDSGSLVVTRDPPEKVVGIVIAGGREKSLVLPLAPALDALGLELVAQHNTS